MQEEMQGGDAGRGEAGGDAHLLVQHEIVVRVERLDDHKDFVPREHLDLAARSSRLSGGGGGGGGGGERRDGQPLRIGGAKGESCGETVPEQRVRGGGLFLI